MNKPGWTAVTVTFVPASLHRTAVHLNTLKSSCKIMLSRALYLHHWQWHSEQEGTEGRRQASWMPDILKCTETAEYSWHLASKVHAHCTSDSTKSKFWCMVAASCISLSAQLFSPEQVPHFRLPISWPCPIAPAMLVMQILKLDPPKPAVS